MSTRSNQVIKPSVIRSHSNCSLKLQCEIITTWNTQCSFNRPVRCLSKNGYPRKHKWLLWRQVLLHREEMPIQYAVCMKAMDTSVRKQAFIVDRTLWFCCTSDPSRIKWDKAYMCVLPSLARTTHSVGITKSHIWLVYNASEKTSVKCFCYSTFIGSIISVVLSLVVSRYLSLWADSCKALKYLGMLGQSDRQQVS